MFSKLSRIVAVFLLIGGVLQLGLGLAIAGGFLGPYEQAVARYTSSGSSGAVIDSAIRLLGAALILGTIAEIAHALRKLGDRPSQAVARIGDD